MTNFIHLYPHLSILLLPKYNIIYNLVFFLVQHSITLSNTALRPYLWSTRYGFQVTRVRAVSVCTLYPSASFEGLTLLSSTLPSICSDFENVPAYFLQYAWYLVRGTICTSTCFVDRHNSSHQLKQYEDADKKLRIPATHLSRAQCFNHILERALLINLDDVS